MKTKQNFLNVMSGIKEVRFDFAPLKSSLTPFILLLALITTTAHAIPGITTEDVRADFATALYNETAVDMRVKVMGGFVEAKRSWYNNRWVFNYGWSDLKFEFKTSTTNTSGEPDSIRRNFMIYELVDSKAATLVWRFNDQRKTITKTETGYRWANREGDFKDYDANGKILKYGNRNNVTVSFTRDINGQIKEIKDHLDKVIITYEFDAADNVSRIVDYTGREVIYTHDANGLLTNVKDVLGYNWKYGYTDYTANKLTGPGNLFSINNMLSSKTNPEGHITKINYEIIGGGTYCSPTGAGSWEINATTGKEEYVGDCVNITTPQSLIMKSINYPDGRTQNYTYTYYGSSKSYSRVMRNASNHLVEESIDLEGIVTRRLENGKEVYNLTKDGTSEIITDGQGNKTRTDFDQWRNPTKVTYADGSFKTWKYEPKFSNVIEKVNENGVMTKYEYDANGNVTKMTEAVGFPEQRVTDYGYDAYGNRTLLKKVGDAVTQTAETKWTYDGFGNVKTKTDPEQNVVTYELYDVIGNVKKIVDPNKKTWTQTYTNAGDLLSKSNPLNHTFNYEYNKIGQGIKEIDPNQNTTIYKYDVNGTLLSVTDPYLATAKNTYNNNGQVISLEDTEGVSKKYSYDKSGNIISSIDGNGNIIKYEYRKDGLLVDKLHAEILPNMRIEYKYDSRGKVLYRIENAGTDNQTTTIYKYDVAGNKTEVIDPKNNKSSYHYDALNRTIKITDSLTRNIFYTYDSRDNILMVKNKKNIVLRKFEYDRNNRRVKEIWTNGQITSYAYDVNGNQIDKIDAKGANEKRVYDDVGRLIEVSNYTSAQENEPAKKTIFSYNKLNNITFEDDGISKHIYTYDKLQRLLSETVDFGVFSKIYRYTYFNNGLKKSFTSPDGVTVSYTYDSNKQLSTVLMPNEGSVSVESYSWSAPNKITLPGGGVKEFTYNASLKKSRVNSKDPGGVSHLDYSFDYDDVGNIISSNTEHGSYSYGYDDLYRLINATSPNSVNEIFEYDESGNRIKTSSIEGPWTYNTDNQLESYGKYSFTYNVNGNTKTKQDISVSPAKVIRTYEYNLENRLSGVKDSSGTYISKYSYDSKGRRILKDVSGELTYYLYSDEGLIAEFDATGNQMQSYGYFPDKIWGTDPLYTKIGSNYYYYHNDSLGVPKQLTNKNGKKMWEATYHSFGKANVTNSNITNNIRLPGQYYDEETGLHYNYFRFYDPSTGRYLESDPIGLEGGINVYNYSESSPVNYYDEYGLSCTTEMKFVVPHLAKKVSSSKKAGPWYIFYARVSATASKMFRGFPGGRVDCYAKRREVITTKYERWGTEISWGHCLSSCFVPSFWANSREVSLRRWSETETELGNKTAMRPISSATVILGQIECNKWLKSIN